MKKFAQYLGILMIMALLAACGGSGSPAAPADPGSGSSGSGSTTPTEEAAAPAEPAGSVCPNDYYPIVDGASWSFAGSSDFGPVNWTTTINGVSSSGFSMTQSFPDLTTQQQWSCDPEGIQALDYGGGPSASLQASGGTTAVYETTGVTGVTFPTHIAAGDTWSQTFNIDGVLTTGDGEESTASGTISQSYSAIGTETVSVPAGSFEAMKIQVDTSFDLTVVVQGITAPVSSGFSETVWLVEGVGWVRSVGEYGTTVELQSYSIP